MGVAAYCTCCEPRSCAAVTTGWLCDESRSRALIPSSEGESAGSGTTTTQVNALLKQFKQVQSMMKQLTGGSGKRPKLGQLRGMDLSQFQG